MREEYSAPDYLNQKLLEPIFCKQCENVFLPDAPGLEFCSVDCYEQSSATQKKPKRKVYRKDEARPKPPAHKPEASTIDDFISDDELWAARARYWQSQCDSEPVKRWTPKAKPIERKPLILTGHGVQLRIDHGTLLIRNGFTHYPQKQEEWRFFPGEWRLPSRIILLDTDGSVSLHVLRWLSEQNVPLIMINYRGEVVSVLGNNGSAVDLSLRQTQIEAQENGLGLKIATQLVKEKIIACEETLRTFTTSKREGVVRKLNAHLKRLKGPIKSISELLLIEARAAADYFSVWYTVPVKWEGTQRNPIPEEWKYIGKRESFISGRNRHATDPVNAMLNYAYAILESRVLIVILAAGLDPTIGYLHSCRPGRAALVYDLMEPSRPKVDAIILKLLRTQTFTPNDFLIDTKGICRLHPRLASNVAEQAIGAYPVEHIVTQISSTKR
jgi:CRISPR-associated protein Cas1